MKARHDEIIHEAITLHNHVIRWEKATVKWQLKIKRGNFLAHRDLQCDPLEPKAIVLPMSNSDPTYFGGVETRSMYIQYFQGIQPNVPAHTTFREIWLW